MKDVKELRETFHAAAIGMAFGAGVMVGTGLAVQDQQAEFALMLMASVLIGFTAMKAVESYRGIRNAGARIFPSQH